jgi:hypothetical protein
MNDEKKRKLAELDRLSREQDELFRQHDSSRSEIYGLGVFFRLFRQKSPRRPDLTPHRRFGREAAIGGFPRNTRRRSPSLEAKNPLISTGYSMRLRGVEPPRPVRATRPSTLRVYQFRHSREGRR